LDTKSTATVLVVVTVFHQEASLRTQAYFRLSLLSARNKWRRETTAENTSAFAGYQEAKIFSKNMAKNSATIFKL